MIAHAETSVPWGWVNSLREQARKQNCSVAGYLRSKPLTSPDQRWAAYSRVRLEASPSGDRLSSVLFVRDLSKGDLQAIYASPADLTEWDLEFALLLPHSWLQQQLLTRYYEGVFQSDIASDRALIWASSDPIAAVQVWEPPPIFNFTELIGWDPADPGRVLFVVGNLGNLAAVVSVGADGQTMVRDLHPEQVSPTLNPDLASKESEWESVLAPTESLPCR